MKKYFFFLLFLFFVSYSYSQICPEIFFSYDASGNRIQRVFYPSNPCNNNNNQDIPPKPPPNSDTNKPLSLEIYPNPTCNILTINITKDTICSDPILVNIYDANAQPVFLGNTARSTITLDVSSLAQGIYIVKVISCGHQSSTVMLKVCNSSISAGPSNSHVKVKQVTEAKF